MTQVVWKFPIPWPPDTDVFSIGMPSGAQVLSVQIQHGEPQMWVLVDPSPKNTRMLRTFLISGIGRLIVENVQYIDTFQMMEGRLVFHIFEVQP